MTPEPRTIASQILIALDHDYAGMPECDDHAGKAWHKLFRKADELGLLDDDLLEAMMQERLKRLDDSNLRLMRLDANAGIALEPAPCTFEVQGDAAVLTVGNLDSTEAADLLAEHADQVRAAKTLVIDVRDCTGGIEQAAYPLLDWLFDEPTTLETLIGTQQVLTNYSTGACKARIQQFTQLKALLEAQGAGDTTAWLDQGLQAAQDSMGKGFVEEALAPACRPACVRAHERPHRRRRRVARKRRQEVRTRNAGGPGNVRHARLLQPRDARLRRPFRLHLSHDQDR